MNEATSRLLNTIYHPEHLLDRTAMLAMRAMIALQPAADLGPRGRAAFDELMATTPAAEGVGLRTRRSGHFRRPSTMPTLRIAARQARAQRGLPSSATRPAAVWHL